MTSSAVAGARARVRTSDLPRLEAGARSPGARAASYGLLLVFWLACVSGPVAQTLTMSRRVAVEGVKTTLAQAVVDAWNVAFYLPAVVAILVIVFRFAFVRNDVAPVLVLITPWLWIILNEFARGGRVSPQMILPIGVAVTFWALQTRVDDLKLYALLTAALAAASMALTVTAPTLMYMPQSFDAASDKSLTGLPLLAGFFSHPNSNGLFLLLALPLAHLFSHWYLRWATAGVILAAIVWSSSRTALFGAAVWLVVMLLNLLLRASLRRVLGVLLIGLVAAIAVIPLTTTDPEAYTDRGAIWQFVLSQLHGTEWIVGLGHTWFTDHYDLLSSALSTAAGHGHNVFANYVVTGGLILVMLIALVLLNAARIAAYLPHRQHVAALAFLCVLAAASITETAWRTDAPDTLFASMIVPLFVIATQSRVVTPALTGRRGEATGEVSARRTRSRPRSGRGRQLRSA
ncbi:O-antigen ligase [Microbacterium sp. VKM Ac-2923]|uniref:O-antigen ligase family protein n=1 Tax=Microbacterium sp. VKM Ac-2923 TaxID=2929476 RepID=UPI001FB22728|nr:hypothetical protein [Microbacterium sp. VKM Ac-2923]MCJ1706108.1 hypothetical protein [Microbacterium sp. VKM Ac-2923]